MQVALNRYWTASPRKHGYSLWNFVTMCPRTRDMICAANDSKRFAYFRFLRRHIGFLERKLRNVPSISIAFCSPNTFRKSHRNNLKNVKIQKDPLIRMAVKCKKISITPSCVYTRSKSSINLRRTSRPNADSNSRSTVRSICFYTEPYVTRSYDRWCVITQFYLHPHTNHPCLYSPDC